MTSMALMGRYFSTSEQAVEFYEKQSEIYKSRHTIVYFNDGFMIISNQQLSIINKTEANLPT